MRENLAQFFSKGAVTTMTSPADSALPGSPVYPMPPVWLNDSLEDLRRILAAYKTVAVVGLSANWHRPSFFAAKYLQQKGFRVVPVNPAYTEVLGQTCYPSLRDIPFAVDVVDCFRREQEIDALCDDAIAIGARCLWQQLGVRNLDAAWRARRAGLDVVIDRCMKIEHARLYGGLGWAGVNTGVISAKRPRMHVVL